MRLIQFLIVLLGKSVKNTKYLVVNRELLRV